MSMVSSIQSLNSNPVVEYSAVDEESYRNQQRFILRLALLIFKGLILLIVVGTVISRPELIPLALIAGIGYNEYYKMQRKDDGSRI